MFCRHWLHTGYSRRTRRIAALVALVLGLIAFPFSLSASAQVASSSSKCQLGNGISHVIYLQFDNVHFTRDNPNVPSDLEQMPHLLNFLEQQGVLLSNHHTPLISHTANDIVTSLTGLYPDNQGLAVSNSYRVFTPSGSSDSAGAFTYWTDPVNDFATTHPSDTTFNQLTATGRNTPAPWVPFTRAGCNVGAAGTANLELENTSPDVANVFGTSSPQAQEAGSNSSQATADFVGIAVHCARGNEVCSTAHTGVPDLLPQEPGGYQGYQSLFGHKYVAPVVSPNGPLTDLNGNVIQDDQGHVGFPGFDGMTPAVSLSYVAAMQEHGIPVTYAYLSDAHDNHATGNAFGPGEAGYVAQLQAYDSAFATFFTRLAHDGINAHNTLFVVTADENDHFVGGAPSPANCNGVTAPCTYSQIGEIDGNLTGLLATQQHVTTPFAVHADSAPAIYLTGNPARTDQQTTRPFEQALGKLTAVNPLTGQTEQLTQLLADPVELNMLHMVTGDPARTPDVIMFANPDYFLFTGASNCVKPCVQEESGFAWNHGDVNPDITTTWLGMVGPGVKHLGVDGQVWSDHTDIRPTMMELLGLRDDYQHEGRVLFEVIKPSALPDAVRDRLETLEDLAQIYKQINAPVGQLSLNTLQISTTALESSSPNDDTYTRLENRLISLTQQRNTIANQIINILEQAEFGNSHGHSDQLNQLPPAFTGLIEQAKGLLKTTQMLATTR